ncbi:MAG TPA: DUF1800 domain-containing protein [Candidatus Acidoferrum sp.]|nr:DUF1800 domain-containing protein [Candidatus Acidoferrum sp.]
MTIPFMKRVTAIFLALSIAAPALPQTTSHPQREVSRPSGQRPQLAALTERERAIHALNRLTFGPRPGDVDAVLQKGVDAWIEDQLHPESIDDSALNAHIGPYATTRMNPKQLAQMFPSDGVIRQVIAGKRPIPDDPESKLIYAVNDARIQQQDAARAQSANAAANEIPAAGAKMAAAAAADAGGKPGPADQPEIPARSIADRLLALPKNERLAALESVPPEQLVNFPSQLRGDQRDRLMADASPQERELMRALANPAGVVASELQQAKLVREIYSERQLLEVMTDFWFNHFNVFQYKNQDVYYTTAYERDVIRPHALGKFYDLLVATAQSPAMLMYLDNWLSIGPHSQAAGKNGQSGLNENYAREIMELHTLGVDGGYTQSDVTELARVLTGWTIAQPDDGGQFQFDPRRHEPGIKTVLGETFYDTGLDEGMHALDMLAHRPATARFISKCIATRFVSDDPPQALVDRMAAKFQSSDGDIREVLRTMFASPEFWSPKLYRAKMKTPLELVVSSVRASGANVVFPDALVASLTAMGMQPYGMAVPTGYSMKSETWDNEGALLARINFSTALTQGNLPGVQFDPNALITLGILTSLDAPRTKAVIADKPTGLDFAIALTEDSVLPGELQSKDEAVIRKQTENPETAPATPASLGNRLRLVVGFILASPEFQHH